MFSSLRSITIPYQLIYLTNKTIVEENFFFFPWWMRKCKNDKPWMRKKCNSAKSKPLLP